MPSEQILWHPPVGPIREHNERPHSSSTDVPSEQILWHPPVGPIREFAKASGSRCHSSSIEARQSHHFFQDFPPSTPSYGNRSCHLSADHCSSQQLQLNVLSRTDLCLPQMFQHRLFQEVPFQEQHQGYKLHHLFHWHVRDIQQHLVRLQLCTCALIMVTSTSHKHNHLWVDSDAFY